MKKKLPDFKIEDDERKFWATADSTEYLDWRSATRPKFANLKTIAKDHIVTAAGLNDRGLERIGKSPRRSLPVSSQGIPR